MSATISLSAAIASLKPGISTSPDDAMRSWTVIKEFYDSVFSFADRNFLLLASATFLLGCAVLTTLIREQISRAEPQATQSPDTRQYSVVKSISYASCMVYTFFQSAVSLGALLNSRIGFFKHFPQHISDLHPHMATSSETSLISWCAIKTTTESINFSRPLKGFLIMGIFSAVTLGAAFLAMRSQRNDDQTSKNRWLDYTSLGSLGMATVVFLTGYLYTKNFAPKI